MPTDDAIDQAILAAIAPRYLKVARIVSDVGEAFGRLHDEPFLLRVGGRIKAMAAAGRIEGAGAHRNWRHSEIRALGSD